MSSEPEPVRISLTVNGTHHSAVVSPRLLLADLLRHQLGLTGTHIGCEQGICGACTVLMDGRTARSCLTFAVQANQKTITTVEGLAADGALTPLQAAFHRNHALQCGYCTPGFLMVMTEFLNDNPDPDDAQIIDALSANICRCTGYVNMVSAVREAANELRAVQATSAAE